MGFLACVSLMLLVIVLSKLAFRPERGDGVIAITITIFTLVIVWFTNYDFFEKLFM